MLELRVILLVRLDVTKRVRFRSLSRPVVGFRRVARGCGLGRVRTLRGLG